MSDFDIDGALVELIELALCGNQAGAIDVSNEIQRQYESAIALMQGEAVVQVRDAGRYGLLVEFIEGKAKTLKAGDKLFTYPPSAATKIAEQDARIKELEQQLEVARKDIKEARIALQTAVYTPNLTMQDMNFLTKHAFNSLEKYKDIDATILQIGGAE